MSEAKIAFQIGQLSYSSEGSENWVATQLDKFIAKLPTISGLVPIQPNEMEVGDTPLADRKPQNVGSPWMQMDDGRVDPPFD